MREWVTAQEEAEEWETFRNTDGGFDISKESNLNAFLADVANGDYNSVEAGASAASE